MTAEDGRDHNVRVMKVVETADKLGFEIDVGSPAAAVTFVKQQYELWEQITKELSLAPQ